MTEAKSDLVRTLVRRGFLHQCTDLDGLDAAAAAGPISGYIGFDCTADSLHVGHQLQIMMLRTLQYCGHKPIVLIGGGTSKVGDPSGRDTSRTLLSDAELQHNIAGVKRSLEGFLKFGDGPGDALLVDNAEWLDRLAYIPFLRDYGRHFSVNRMLAFDSVRLRLEREQPLSFLEFNYMVLQAYDFLELSRRHGCILQLGGSDQWGNIVNGVELARRVEQRTLYGFTAPLVTTASGAKMGKTAQGAVWLNADRLPPFDYYQFWRNTDDADVGRFLRLFTELPLDEIERLERLEGAEINEAKRILAFEATRLCHGEEAARAAAAAAHAVFVEPHTAGGGDRLPTVDIPMRELELGIPAFELFCRAGLAETNGEARRLIRGGGARIENEPVRDETQRITATNLRGDNRLRLSAGKKRHVEIRAA
jgi:tyrosyl-tRNA synthetase